MEAQNKTLLLVEDEAIIALNSAALLERAGFTVLRAASGEQALDMALDAGKRIDLVLMDIDLGPGISGTIAAEQILEQKDLPVVFLTSHSELDFVARAEKISAYGYVTKSSGELVLKTAIRMAFRLHESRMELKRANHDLRERVRELHCMYEISRLCSDTSVPLDTLLSRIAHLIQSGFERPSATVVRIQVGERSFQVDASLAASGSSGIAADSARASGDIPDHSLIRASIGNTASVLGEITACDVRNAAFLPEERTMVSAIADQLGWVIGNRREHGEHSDHTQNYSALAEEKLRLEGAIEASDLATWEWHVQSGEMSINRRWAESLGYRLEELQPVNIHTWENLVHPEDLPEAKSQLMRHFAGELHYYAADYRMRCRNGSYLWNHDRGRVIRWSEEGEPLLMFGTHTDINQRKIAEGQTNSHLKETELLLDEVHHRVKNNLSTIRSLLSLQASRSDSSETSDALSDAMRRVQSMATLYDTLYRTQHFRDVPVQDYLPTLVTEIVSVFPETPGIEVSTDVDQFTLAARALSSIGILLNELITNAVKYAFPDGRGGRIRVSARREEEEVVLIVEDNGQGLPEAVDIGNSCGLGLTIVSTLAEQLGGRIEIDRKRAGTRFVLRFRG